MSFTISAYSVLLLINALLLLFLSIYLYTKREFKGATAFSLMMLSVAWWSGAEFCESLGVSFEAKVFFAKLAYLGIVFGGAQWVLFSLEYANVKKSTITYVKKLIYIIPAIILLAVATNDLHHLYWSNIIQISSDRLMPMIYEKGPLHYLNTIYQYLVLTYGVIILWRYSLNIPENMRKQVQFTIYAILIPWIFNIIYNTSSTVFNNYDITPVVFLVMGGIIIYNMFRNKFLGLISSAVQNIYEQLDSGIIISNSHTTVVDYNKFVKGIFGKDLKKGIEFTSLAKIKGYQRCVGGEATEFYDNKTKKWYEVKRSPFSDSAGDIGYIVFFYDITDKKEVEREILEAKVYLTTILNFIPEVVIAMDNDGRITMWNHNAEMATGVKAEEVIGKKNRVYSKKVYGKIRPLLANLLLEATPDSIENYDEIEVTKDSFTTYGTLNKKEYLFNAKLLYNAAGEQIGAIESGIDLTDQRKVNRELEDRVETLVKLNEVMLKRESRIRKLSKELDKLKKSK